MLNFFPKKGKKLYLRLDILKKHYILRIMTKKQDFYFPEYEFDIFPIHCKFSYMNITSQISISQRSTWLPEMENQYSIWCAEVIHEHWEVDTDIMERYPKAQIYPHCNIVFPILHGKAVIETHVEYQLERVFVTFVGLKTEWQDTRKESA